VIELIHDIADRSADTMTPGEHETRDDLVHRIMRRLLLTAGMELG